MLTFSPALGESVRLAISGGLPGAAVQGLVFKAAFDSPASYEYARSAGVRVELWTNFPVEGRPAGEWGPLAFAHQDATEHSKVLPLFSQEDAQEYSVYAKLPNLLRQATHGSWFAFTYRLVYPSGYVQWLGEYGRDGQIVVEHAPIHSGMMGVSLFDGLGWDSKVELNDLPVGETLVGRLSNDYEWSSWTIGESSRPVLSRSGETSPATTVVLYPRPHAHSVLPPTPLVLMAEGASVRIGPHGDIVAITDKPGGHLVLTTVGNRASAAISGLYADEQHFVASIGSGATLPLSLLVLPRSSHRSRRTEVHLDYQSLANSLPGCGHGNLLVTASSAQNFVSVPKDGQVALRVGEAGGSAVIAPVYTIEAADGAAKGGWNVSILSEHTNAIVHEAKEEEVDVLPTPPPSPPPIHREVQRPPVLPLPSFPEASEITSSVASSAASTSAAVSSSVTSPSLPANLPVPESKTDPEFDRDQLVLQKMSNIDPAQYYLGLVVSAILWVWRDVLQRVAFFWLEAAGVSIAEDISSDAVEDDETEPIVPVEVDSTDSENLRDATSAKPEPLETSIPQSAITIASIQRNASVLSSARESKISTQASLSADVSSQTGQLSVFVQAPSKLAASISSLLQFVLDGKQVPEPDIVYREAGGACIVNIHTPPEFRHGSLVVSFV